MKVFNKLVRDKIPEIIENNNEFCKTRILNDDEYLVELNKKIKEELNEYLESGEIEELADLEEVLRAIHNGDLEAMREISDFFYKTSGIYSRLCRYMAYLYRYDWLITPYINDDNLEVDKVLDGFYKAFKHIGLIWKI